MFFICHVYRLVGLCHFHRHLFGKGTNTILRKLIDFAQLDLLLQCSLRAVNEGIEHPGHRKDAPNNSTDASQEVKKGLGPLGVDNQHGRNFVSKEDPCQEEKAIGDSGIWRKRERERKGC